MTLSEAYLQDIAGLSVKERQSARSRWHQAAKRYLVMMSITSDTVLNPQPNGDGITTMPYGRFFITHGVHELEELYILTAPSRRRKSAKTDAE